MTRLFVLLCILILSSCAGTQTVPLDKALLPALKSNKLTLITHESPSFVAMTSGKGMFAVVGVGAAVSAGNQLVKDNQIEDPAAEIGRQLALDLDVRLGLEVDSGKSMKVESTEIADIAKAASGKDYALDVETVGWSFIYDGFSFSEYIVGYSVKTRLIDVKKKKAVSKGMCSYDTKSAGKPNVSYETLVENDAAYIKQALQDATVFCVEKFKKEIF